MGLPGCGRAFDSAGTERALASDVRGPARMKTHHAPRFRFGPFRRKSPRSPAVVSCSRPIPMMGASAGGMLDDVGSDTAPPSATLPSGGGSPLLLYESLRARVASKQRVCRKSCAGQRRAATLISNEVAIRCPAPRHLLRSRKSTWKMLYGRNPAASPYHVQSDNAALACTRNNKQTLYFFYIVARLQWQFVTPQDIVFSRFASARRITLRTFRAKRVANRSSWRLAPFHWPSAARHSCLPKLIRCKPSAAQIGCRARTGS
jgi:hypothetical protein